MNPFEIRLELVKLATEHLWKVYEKSPMGFIPTGATIVSLAKELDRFVSTPTSTRTDR